MIASATVDDYIGRVNTDPDTAFGLTEVAQAIGKDRGVVHSWMARGHLKVQSRGPRISRRFSFADTVEMACIAELVRGGMTIVAASAAVYSVSGALRKALQDRYGEGKTLVLGAGQSWVLPSESVPGFVRDLGLTSATLIVLANVASATHRALSQRTAIIPAEATLQATETIVRRALPERAKGEGVGQ